MGGIRIPPPARLVVGLLGRAPESVEPALVERFGPVSLASPILPFDYTPYYEAEMGRDLRRRYLAFDRLIDPGALAEIKRWTNGLEGPSPRAANVDPGYVTRAKLVLASTKERAHRVYLGGGVYAEATLAWAKGGFVPFEWTYPDYRAPEAIAFFTAVRNSLGEPR